MSLILRPPWTQQPQFFAPVAKTELARGLEFAWSGIGDADVFGRATTKTGSGTIVVAPMGKVFSNARGQYLDTLQNYTATGSNRPITYAGWFAADNLSTGIDCLMSVGNPAANYSSFGVYCNVIANGDIYVGTVYADVYTAGWQFSAGQWVSLVVSFDGTGNFGTGTCRVWVNRQQKSTTFSGVSGTHNITQTPVRLMNERSASSRAFRGKVGPSGLWSRPWTQYDVDAWHANPWQLFEPRRIWVPVSAAGGGSVTLTAAQGSYSLTGQAAGLRVARTLTAAQGSYSLSGQAASIRTARQLVAGQGAYALMGQSSALRAARQIAAAQGSYALTGQAATLTYSGAGAKTLTADAGSYALTGQAAALRVARKFTAGQGAYSYTGQDAALRRLYTLTAGQGAYALTGQPAGILRGLRLPAAQGSYTLSGQAATLTYSGAAGSTISIVPPYIAVYFWKRTA